MIWDEHDVEGQVQDFIKWNNANFKDKIDVNMNYQRIYNILRHNSDSLLGKRLLERTKLYTDMKRSEKEKMFNSTINYEFIEEDE